MCSRAAAAESAVSTSRSSMRSCSASGSACKSAGSSSTIRMRLCVIEDIPLPSICWCQGKLDKECCPLARMIFDPDRAMMLLNNAIGNRKPQPCSRSHILGRKERIEDALLQPLWNSAAGIAETQRDDAWPDLARNFDPFVQRVCQRVAGVGQQVNEDLFQLDGIANDYRLRWPQFQQHLDLSQAKLLLHQ